MLDNKTTADFAIEYIECINRRDFARLAGIMAPDHKALDENDKVIAESSENVINMIRDYINSGRHHFQIHISDIYVNDKKVFVIGRTSGAKANETRSSEIVQRKIYVFKMENNLVKNFKFAIDDTEKARQNQGLTNSRKIT